MDQQRFELLELNETSVDLIEAEKLWEMEAVERGVARYRRAVAEASLADTAPGHRLTTALLVQVVAALEKIQADAAEGIAKHLAKDVGAPVERWLELVNLLDAEKLAVIALRTLLTNPGANNDRRLLSIAMTAGQSCKMQLEFEEWKANSKGQGYEPGRKNLFKELTTKTAVIDQKTFNRWRTRFQDIPRIRLEREERLKLGALLVMTAADNSTVRFGDQELTVFERKKFMRDRKTEHVVEITEDAMAWINREHEHNELMRPVMVPMVCKPRPWVGMED